MFSALIVSFGSWVTEQASCNFRRRQLHSAKIIRACLRQANCQCWWLISTAEPCFG